MTPITFRIAAAIMACSLCADAHAACPGLDAVLKEGAPLYPPIAKAAHVQGIVRMTAHFASDGTVRTVEVISGHEMLRAAAAEYVKTWQANAYHGERSCPVTVEFVEKHDADHFASGRVDLQRVIVAYDPSKALIQPQRAVIN